ncbi:MAG: ComF family protein [Clostridia bacterium]|nr:ComF family protein [Clostridia bacterium]
MRLKEFLSRILTFGLYDPKWRCNVCGKEIFGEEYFCKECYDNLPFNDKTFCQHCGRETDEATDYCLTCKGFMVSVDAARSVFTYKKPINSLIKKAKYGNGKYLLSAFAETLSYLYFKNSFNADVVCFVPMTEKRKRKRGYNQSEELATRLSEIIKVPVTDCLVKSRETERQAKLGKADRKENLKGSFKVSDKKSVNGKTVLLVDDVTTTGATAETLAETLKKAGAVKVYLLTVASVPAKKEIKT